MTPPSAPAEYTVEPFGPCGRQREACMGQTETFYRVLGYILVAAGVALIITALPLWFWLGLLGAACVAAGWALAGSRR